MHFPTGPPVTVLTKSAARQMDRVASFSMSEHTTLFEDLHDRAAHAAGALSAGGTPHARAMAAHSDCWSIQYPVVLQSQPAQQKKVCTTLLSTGKYSLPLCDRKVHAGSVFRDDASCAESILETAAELSAPLLGRGGGNGHSTTEGDAAEQAPTSAVEQQVRAQAVFLWAMACRQCSAS